MTKSGWQIREATPDILPTLLKKINDADPPTDIHPDHVWVGLHADSEGKQDSDMVAIIFVTGNCVVLRDAIKEDLFRKLGEK